MANSTYLVKKTTVFDVADAFLCLESMNPLKLQKLCYYAYVWWLVNYNEKIFEDQFEAWVHGPVCPDLYFKYNQSGVSCFGNIPQNNKFSNYDLMDYIKAIFAVYGKYSGSQLERLTHKETPWIKARGDLKPWQRGNTIIQNKDIIDFYRAKLKE
jgi:Uncharacterized phage-associated protein